MSSRLAADRRIRAASLRAAPGLDVRGPVSQALGRAGIAVPPAPLAGAVPSGVADEPGETADLYETAAPDTTPAPTASRSKAAPRVVKPFDAAPWPTRKPRPAPPEPPATLSGLTADERRVHRILLDTLAIDNARDGVSDGLSYAEKKRLATLDLSFVDGEIAKMEARPSFKGARWVALALALGAAFPLALATGKPLFETGLFLVLAVVAAVSLASRRVGTPAGPQRLAIYRALRELALLVDDAPVSGALQQADRLIDRLAGVAPDEVGATPVAGRRQRVRS